MQTISLKTVSTQCSAVYLIVFLIKRPSKFRKSRFSAVTIDFTFSRDKFSNINSILILKAIYNTKPPRPPPNSLHPLLHTAPRPPGHDPLALHNNLTHGHTSVTTQHPLQKHYAVIAQTPSSLNSLLSTHQRQKKHK
jgi:hypothetical protein